MSATSSARYDGDSNSHDPRPREESSVRWTVGIVDDDSGLLRALQRLLRTAGFSVEAFESAEALLASGSLPRIHCLVIDIHLGGMSGFDLQERLAETAPTIPIIFITALDDAPTRDRASKVGAGYLRKPFDEPAFLGMIGRALDAAVA
jgi:FixJ family two-component response regulator